MRGLALSNSDKIRYVHNSFARFIYLFFLYNKIISIFNRQQLFEFDSRDEKKDEDAYHFIAYVPFKGNHSSLI